MSTLVQRARAHGFDAMKRAGLFRRLESSSWRTSRLLILCYHGVSLADEHEWRPALYISREHLAHRLELLKTGGYNVLQLDDALERMYSRRLPPKSVVLTFDDGGHDFYEAAYPLLRLYGFPATVYLRTDYCGRPMPVFLIMLSYLLWKSLPVTLESDAITGQLIVVDTRTGTARQCTADTIAAHVSASRLSQQDRDSLLERLADILQLDYGAIRTSRLLQIMSTSEVTELSASGVDFQLHMHNHHSPRTEPEYRWQIQENRRVIENLTAKTPVHLCYPSGVHAREFLPWLSEEGVKSATTCVPGIADPSCRPLLLPRFIDTMQRSPVDFAAWLSGAGALATRKPRYDA